MSKELSKLKLVIKSIEEEIEISQSDRDHAQNRIAGLLAALEIAKNCDVRRNGKNKTESKDTHPERAAI